ncbi:MAG: antitoxin Xre/MbcA/ParS toxin-binding domain-containing protein [Terracidiphilus sp.]|jgi:putative toxin-antitoxin system antitoxin component (TIGR02293 family)
MSIAEIVDVLGGKRTFKQPIRKADDLAAQVRLGLPASTVNLLAGTLSMQRAQVAKCLNIPARTLSRRLAMKSRLTHEESDRTLRMARVVALANEVLGTEEKASHWMVAPNRALGGKRPFDQLDTEIGVSSVEEVLYSIAYGMYS